MVPILTSRIRSFFRPRAKQFLHPEAEVSLELPRRIDGPAAAKQLAMDLLRHRREEVTMAIYLDERHRLVGTAILATGWVQAARLSARPLMAGATACRASAAVLVRYGRYRALSNTDAEDRSFGSLSSACGQQGVLLLDQIAVSGLR